MSVGDKQGKKRDMEAKASKHASKRVHACARRVRVRVCATVRAWPNGRAARRGARRGWERTPQPCVCHACGVAKVETRGRVPGEQ